MNNESEIKNGDVSSQTNMDLNTNMNPVSQQPVMLQKAQFNPPPVMPQQPIVNQPPVMPTQPIVNQPPVMPQQDIGQQFGPVPVKLDSNKIKKIAAVVISAIVVAAIIIFVAFFSGGPDAVLKKYADAYLNLDGKLMAEVMHPKMLELVDDQIEFFKKIDDSEEAQSMEDAEDFFVYSFNLVKKQGLKYTKVEIDDEYKIVPIGSTVDFHDKTFDSNELLKDLKSWGIEKSEVKELRLYYIEGTSTYNGDEETSGSVICVGKVGSKWYVLKDGI